MTRLFIGSAVDVPHLQHPYGPASTACGLPLIAMREITETQAAVWLNGQRCVSCTTRIEAIARVTR